MGPSGQAGDAVKKETRRRKGHAHRGRGPSRSTGLESSRCSQPAVSINRATTHKRKTCSRTQPFTLERAFNLDAMKTCFILNKDSERRTERRKVQSRHFLSSVGAFNLDTFIICLILSKGIKLRQHLVSGGTRHLEGRMACRIFSSSCLSFQYLNKKNSTSTWFYRSEAEFVDFHAFQVL